MVTSLRLVELDSYGNAKQELVLRPAILNANGIQDTIACTSHDLGYPEVRVTSHNNTVANGTTDSTQYHGASTVSVELTLIGPQKEQVHDQLRGMSRASTRLYMYVKRDSWTGGERRMLLRPNPLTFSSDRASAGRLKVNMSWSNPAGIAESVNLNTIWLGAQAAAQEGGIVFPITFPLTWPSSSGTPGGAVVYNAGGIPVLPQIYIYGQCTNPQLVFRNSNQTIYLKNLLVESDHYVLIDVPSKQVLVDSILTNSRYSAMSTLKSDGWNGWPVLEPGDNTVDFFTTSRDQNAHVILEFRAAWI